MPYYDSFDICEAHCVLEGDYNRDGWLRERPSNQRRMESTSTQLHRMGFRGDWSLCYGTLTENGKAIYDALLVRYGLYKLDEE